MLVPSLRQVAFWTSLLLALCILDATPVHLSAGQPDSSSETDTAVHLVRVTPVLAEGVSTDASPQAVTTRFFLRKETQSGERARQFAMKPRYVIAGEVTGGVGGTTFGTLSSIGSDLSVSVSFNIANELLEAAHDEQLSEDELISLVLGFAIIFSAISGELRRLASSLKSNVLLPSRSARAKTRSASALSSGDRT